MTDALTQPSPSAPPSHSKKVFAGLGLGAVAVIILLVVILGGIGGPLIYQAAQQPNIQATAIDIPPRTANPRTSTVVDERRIANSGGFDYTTTLPGTYSLVFDNSFSVFASKSVSVSYSAGGSSSTRSLEVEPGLVATLSFTLTAGQRLSGTVTVSGGSGNDIDFYITAETCTQRVNFAFVLVNSGNANGYATVEFQVDGQVFWTNRYFVTQGQQLPVSGNVVLSDCSGHVYNVVVSRTDKA